MAGDWSVGLSRFVPEPRNTVASYVGNALGAVANKVAGAAGIEGPFLDLIREQMRWQEQMQLVSLYSNVEKSKHETQMAPIRNVRVG